MILLNDLKEYAESTSFLDFVACLTQKSDGQISLIDEVSLSDISFLNDDLRGSNLSFEDVKSIINSDMNMVCGYIVARDAFFNSAGGVEQDNAEKMRSIDDDKDIILSVNPDYPMCSIFYFVIEYIILSGGDVDKLKRLIKYLRIPKSVQHIKNLVSIYNSVI